MKRQRLRFKLLALFFFGLFAALAVYGGYSVLTNGSRWFASSHNSRVRSQKQQVTAGNILDRDGAVLAYTADDQRRYSDDEATRRALVHTLGDADGLVRNGVESFHASYLYGFRATVFEQISQLFSGAQSQGDTVQLTLSAPLSVTMASALEQAGGEADAKGAAVVMNWKTGEILSMISLPTFDPESASEAAGTGAAVNRATEGLYRPGSVFGVVTGSAALQDSADLSAAVFDCSATVCYVGDEAVPGAETEAHGPVTLSEAFAAGCDRMLAAVAVSVGDSALRQAAEHFGCGDNFLFDDLIIENSIYPSAAGDALTTARRGIGLDGTETDSGLQGGILMTPLHLCMITSAIANDGVMMEPKLLLRVTSPSGAARASLRPAAYRICVDSQTAAALKSWMRSASAIGPASAAAVEGLPVCGKTGSGDNCAVYVGFIDDSQFPYAVCVLIEGGTEADAAMAAAQAFAWLQASSDAVP